MAGYSAHQLRIIRGYYRNLDQIRAQRLQELAGEIWLANTQKKQDRLWQRAAELLEKGDAAPAEVRHIIEKRDVEGLASLVSRE